MLNIPTCTSKGQTRMV